MHILGIDRSCDQLTEKSGTPVMIEFIPEMKTKESQCNFKQSEESSSQKFDKLFYRVPDVVK